MNTVATVRIERPPGISENEPVPIPLNNTLEIHLEAKYGNGQAVSLSGAKIYVTIKANLADSDENAKLQKDSASNPAYFSIDSVSAGLYRVIVPAGDLISAGLGANTNYYIDTQIILSEGTVLTHLYDVIRPFKQVTDATS